MSAKRSFLRLQTKWYAKLKKSGFSDIEKQGDSTALLSNKGNGYSKLARHPYNFEETQNFYRLAAWFLHEFKFESKIDRRIWELFCEGLSIRLIGLDKKVRLSKRAVHRRLQKILQGPFQDYRKMVFHDAN